VIHVRHGIWDNSVVQGAVVEGTIMPVLVGPGTTIMIPHAMYDQTMLHVIAHVDCIMAHILGPNADKI
jgi:hypothetical protein